MSYDGEKSYPFSPEGGLSMGKTFWEGNVVEIFLFPNLDTPGQSVSKAHLFPGRGIEGGRHYLQAEGTTENTEPAYEVTLIESEAIAAVQEETCLPLFLTAYVPILHSKKLSRFVR
jgi:hypothetical protein